ncbi:hypothetical protein PHISP_03672 [Aspergillus sp. HF37]|nr:hypothetical protein PHISP_03672 [Aspergillus sp. HF37]
MSLPKHTTAPTVSSPSNQPPREIPSSPVPRPGSRRLESQDTTTTPAEQPAQEPGADHDQQPGEDGQAHDAPPSQRPQFQPFFTLIEDAHSSEYFHPTVHYIFSDDDTGIVAEAALRSLENEQEGSNSGKGAARAGEQHEPAREEEREGDRDNSGPPSPRKEPLLPPPIPGVRDNYVILDVEPRSFDRASAEPGSGSGPGTTRSLSTSPASQPPTSQQHQQQQHFTVTSAHSLTPSWQVVDTQPANGGLMLKIHGTAGIPGTLPRDRERDKEKGSQRLEEMMDQFAKRMSELRRVIEAGEQEIPTEDLTDRNTEPSATDKPEGQPGEDGGGEGQPETHRQEGDTGDTGQGSDGEHTGDV